ncbi:MAG: dihydropteroate synthase [Caldimicrobium sp.]
MFNPIQIRGFTFDWKDIPYLMGIINVTPDSFSDGGEAGTLERALEKAEHLLKSGAHILDIGGESTRPFSDPVPEEVEIKRVIPVIKALREKFPEAIISVDTYKARVAELALESGADLVNDISGGQFDKNMVYVIRDFQCPVIIMHIKGTPKTMQINPQYGDVVKEIKDYFYERIDFLTKKGIIFDKIIIDPGLGFGKTFQHNIEIIKKIEEFKEVGRPILLGPSRKSFIGEIINKPPKERDGGTAGFAVYSFLKGIHFIRVHNVSLVHDVLKIFKFFWGDETH